MPSSNRGTENVQRMRPRSALASNTGGAFGGGSCIAKAPNTGPPPNIPNKTVNAGTVDSLNKKWGSSPTIHMERIGISSPDEFCRGTSSTADTAKAIVERQTASQIGGFGRADSPASPLRPPSLFSRAFSPNGRGRQPKVERLRDCETRVHELSRDHWMAKLDSTLFGAGALPSYQEWRRNEKTKDAQKMSAPRENKASLLRKSIREAEIPPPPPQDPTMPDPVVTLAALEKRIRAKIEQQLAAHHDMDVGTEPLLMEIQVYDGLFNDALQPAEIICPAVASLLHLLWDSFASITTDSLRLQMKQLTNIQNENFHNAKTLLQCQRELQKLQAGHVKAESELKRKSNELTRVVQNLNETKTELERLRRVTFRAGVNANFDPLQLADTLDVLDEAEASNKHSQMILGEMEKVLAAQAGKDLELAGLAYHMGTTMPQRFKLELDKLTEQNQNLNTRQQSLVQTLESVTQSAEKFALMVQKTKQPDETPRPDWNYILEACVPQVIEQKIPGLVTTTTVKDADYRGSTRDRILILCELLGRMMPSEHVGVKPESSNAQYFDPLGMGAEVKAYLRTKNPVRNRNINKRDTEILVRGILSTRSSFQQGDCLVFRSNYKSIRNYS